jgi:hypothetical protein
VLRLPHPELAATLDRIKNDVVDARGNVVGDVEVSYAIYRPGPDTADLGACYDEDGTIYIPEDLVKFDELYADLVALHEHVEIQLKLAGRSHAYAHRHGLVKELLTAKRLHGQSELQRYIRWRVDAYPESKVPDREELVAQITGILSDVRPRKGQLLKVIKQHRL